VDELPHQGVLRGHDFIGRLHGDDFAFVQQGDFLDEAKEKGKKGRISTFDILDGDLSVNNRLSRCEQSKPLRFSVLEPGDRSHCRNRINRDGTLCTLVYGNPCTFHVDPVRRLQETQLRQTRAHLAHTQGAAGTGRLV
jgi:hypothetical protein